MLKIDPIKIIQGPPGTGKTTTIAALAAALASILHQQQQARFRGRLHKELGRIIKVILGGLQRRRQQTGKASAKASLGPQKGVLVSAAVALAAELEWRLLVTAASNAAVSELQKKLAAAIKALKFVDGKGNPIDVTMVRWACGEVGGGQCQEVMGTAGQRHRGKGGQW